MPLDKRDKDASQIMVGRCGGEEGCGGRSRANGYNSLKVIVVSQKQCSISWSKSAAFFFLDHSIDQFIDHLAPKFLVSITASQSVDRM